MNILVTAKTCARENKVVEIDRGYYKVSVKEKPVGGKANKAIINAMAEYLHIAPSRISIRLGKTSKEKLLSVV